MYLLGKTIEFEVSLADVPCGCMLSIYLVNKSHKKIFWKFFNYKSKASLKTLASGQTHCDAIGSEGNAHF